MQHRTTHTVEARPIREESAAALEAKAASGELSEESAAYALGAADGLRGSEKAAHNEAARWEARFGAGRCFAAVVPCVAA